jgi:predicted membrane protein
MFNKDFRIEFRILFLKRTISMAAIFSIFSAVVCILAIIYALKAYRDTRKLKIRVDKEEAKRPKPRY